MKNSNVKGIYIILGIVTMINILTLDKISRFNSSAEHMLTNMETFMDEQKRLAINALLDKKNNNENTQNSGSQDYAWAVLRDEIQKTVHLAITDAKKQSDTLVYDDNTEEEKSSPEIVQTQKKNFNNAYEIIDTAIANGKWEHNDNVRIVTYLNNLSIEQQSKLCQKLAVAINTNKIKMIDDPIF